MPVAWIKHLYRQKALGDYLLRFFTMKICEFDSQFYYLQIEHTYLIPKIQNENMNAQHTMWVVSNTITTMKTVSFMIKEMVVVCTYYTGI